MLAQWDRNKREFMFSLKSLLIAWEAHGVKYHFKTTVLKQIWRGKIATHLCYLFIKTCLSMAAHGVKNCVNNAGERLQAEDQLSLV